MKNNLDKTSKKVGRFLQTFTSESTYYNYKSALKNFFDYIKKSPDEYIKDVRLMENGEKIKQMDIYENDITSYRSHLIKIKKAPKSVNTYLGAIKVFFQDNHIKFDDKLWSNFKKRGDGNQALTREKKLTHEIIEQILNEGDTKSRAMVLMLASSGMRIGELLSLTIDDIDFESEPTKIIISSTIAKNKKSRITFVTDEATRYLNAWLGMRDTFLEKSCARFNKDGGFIDNEGNKIYKSMDDDTVFPFTDDNARGIWNRMLRDAGIDEQDKNTKIHMYRIHGLRKFFRQNFIKSGSGQSLDAVEQLMGHEGYLQSEYARLSEEELRQEYIKSEEFLMICDKPILKKEAQERINQLEHQLKQQDEMLQKIIAEQTKQLRDEIKEQELLEEAARTLVTSENIKLTPGESKKYKQILKI
jgi:integrase